MPIKTLTKKTLTGGAPLPIGDLVNYRVDDASGMVVLRKYDDATKDIKTKNIVLPAMTSFEDSGYGVFYNITADDNWEYRGILNKVSSGGQQIWPAQASDATATETVDGDTMYTPISHFMQAGITRIVTPINNVNVTHTVVTSTTGGVAHDILLGANKTGAVALTNDTYYPNGRNKVLPHGSYHTAVVATVSTNLYIAGIGGTTYSGGMYYGMGILSQSLEGADAMVQTNLPLAVSVLDFDGVTGAMKCYGHCFLSYDNTVWFLLRRSGIAVSVNLLTKVIKYIQLNMPENSIVAQFASGYYITKSDNGDLFVYNLNANGTLVAQLDTVDYDVDKPLAMFGFASI